MCTLFLVLLIAIANGAEFAVTFDSYPNLTQSITSGHHTLNGLITIPDIFVNPNLSTNDTLTKRRLKEMTLPPTVRGTSTPAPTTKLILPVVVLIHPEGVHDRSLKAHNSIFDDLKDTLVSEGKMAVIQFDKRNCISPNCSDVCPSTCPNHINQCKTVGECYNDTNITVSDLILDAKVVCIQGMAQIKPYLNDAVIDVDNLWSIPIGFSFQGASIATYIASKYSAHHTAISLMGSGVAIDQLLLHQLQWKARNNSQIRSLQHTFECIKNGSLNDTDIVNIENEFLSDAKSVKYWKDWLQITQEIEYEEIVNFLGINSVNDELVTPQSFQPLKDLFNANASIKLDMNVMKDMNHYMMNNGKYTVDERVTQHIITFVNDICGYLDRFNHWIMINKTNHSSAVMDKDAEPSEDDTVYKVLLYIAIMVIILILAFGIYFICANKVCPYELEDERHHNHGNEDQRDRERRRRRRRRHRRERERRRAAHRNNNEISLLQPETQENNNNNANDNINSNGNVLLQNEPPQLRHPIVSELQYVE